jgi:hypothetical protein
MRKLLSLLSLLTMLSVPAAAEDPRLSFVEQDLRNLTMQVRALTQQVDALRAQAGRISPAAAVAPDFTPATEVPPWVNAAKWRQLRKGMTELEVVSALGPPTSMREEGGARVLLYALEIGASGFLGGSVTLRNRSVAEVRQPVLQ